MGDAACGEGYDPRYLRRAEAYRGGAGEMRMALSYVAAVAMAMTILASGASAQSGDSATTKELTAMLGQFLNDAGTGNRAGFDRFFAEDVIYTRNTGVVSDKADIMRNVGTIAPSAESKNVYSAEDVTVHDLGDTGIVSFRLVARTEHKDGKSETAYYRNTATFLRRGGKWQVVAWQATKIAEPPAK